MQHLVAMAVDKAMKFTDEELLREIQAIKSGKRKLYETNEYGQKLPLHPLILPCLERELERRRKRKEET
jgi:hypothetical protein